MNNSSDKKRSIIVSLFILAGIAIFLAAVFTLGGKQKRFVKNIQVKTVMNDVSGLIAGNNVWFSGVKIGTVKSIEFYGNSQVLVTMNIEAASQQYIRKDSKTKLSTEGLIGNRIVVITGGSPAATEVADGDMLAAVEMTSTDEIMETLQANNKNLIAITSNFKVLSDRIVKGEGTAGALLSDDKMANDLKSTIANLSLASSRVDRTASELNSFAHRMNRPNSSLNNLLTDTAMFSSIQQSLSQLKSATNNANQLSLNLKNAGDRLENGQSAAGVLLSDEETAKQLRAIIQNLQSSSVKLNENLEALQHSFLLRGFFRKKNKTE